MSDTRREEKRREERKRNRKRNAPWKHYKKRHTGVVRCRTAFFPRSEKCAGREPASWAGAGAKTEADAARGPSRDDARDRTASSPPARGAIAAAAPSQ